MQGSSERALKKGHSGLVAAVERWGGSEWEDGRVAGRGQALEKAHTSQNEGKRARSWVIRDQGIWRESVRGSYFTREVRGATCRGARRGPSGEHTRLSTDGKNDILAPPNTRCGMHDGTVAAHQSAESRKARGPRGCGQTGDPQSRAYKHHNPPTPPDTQEHDFER